MKKLLNNLPLYNLPMWFKLLWAKAFIRMFRGFGETFNNDIVLYNELRLWIDTEGRPSTSNANYVMNTMECYHCTKCMALLEEECVCFENQEDDE